METELYKVRSVSRTISDAFTLYTDNFKKIINHTKVPVIALAIVLAFYLQQMNALTAPGEKSIFLAPVLGAIFILLLACSCWLSGSFLTLLNGQKTGYNIMRIVKLVLYMWLLLIGPCIILGVIAGFSSVAFGNGTTTPMATDATPDALAAMGSVMLLTIVFTLLLVAVLLPVYYSGMKYLMEPGVKLTSVIGRNYRNGWRSWGFLFGVMFVTALITMVCAWIIQLPAGVLTFAENLNKLGVSMGDGDGMPTWFSTVQLLVLMVCAVLYIYVELWTMTVLYFAYGTVEAKVRLRNNEPLNQPQDANTTLPMQDADFPEITE